MCLTLKYQSFGARDLLIRMMYSKKKFYVNDFVDNYICRKWLFQHNHNNYCGIWWSFISQCTMSLNIILFISPL
jgi:hypothetical protein